MSNLPISQQWHEAAERWVDAEAAASLLEETKSAVLSQMMAGQGDMAVNRAELTTKASAEWRDYVEKIVKARTAANRAKIQMQYMKMRFDEWSSAEANHRAQARL